jgi:glyoxylase-like metal-dependent hydrolase (beta-lactamase superfamily II)
MSWITIGEAEIHRVEELRVRLPFEMFGASEEVVAANADWLKPVWLDDAGTWDMVVQSFIVVADGRVTVVDPCVGNGRPLPAFPIFDNLDTPFIERFGATGFKPEDVDAVVCTHLHSDHCGWNTVLRDGKYVPTFPNARYVIGWREVERWDTRRPGHKHIPENEGVFERSVLPILEAGLADVIGDSHAVSASLRAELANGHTLGHMALHLDSAGKHGWFTGDAFHHPIELIHPELDEHSCEDYPLTVATRKRLIETFLAQGALIIPAHFTEPHAGYLREADGKRQFVPLT